MPQPPPTINFTVSNLTNDPRFGAYLEDYSPSGSWSKRDVSEPIPYDVDFNLEMDAITFFLGLEYQGFDLALHRTLPFPHPRFSYLFATRIPDKRYIKFKSRQPGTLASGISSGGLPVPYSAWDCVRMYVDFQQPPYRVRSDADVTGTVEIWQQSCSPSHTKVTPSFQREWQRWVTVSPLPYADFNEVEGQTYAFAEGPFKGRALKGSVGLSQAKEGIRVKWWQVPHEYVHTPPTTPGDPGIPWNILAGINKVNAYDFMGYPAGTLLCADPPQLDPYISPVQVGPVPLPVYDITFDWKFVDPPKGVPTSAVRGHQLDQAADGLWYQTTRTPFEPPDDLVSQTNGDGRRGDPNSPPKFATYPFAYFFLPPVGTWLNWYTWKTTVPC